MFHETSTGTTTYEVKTIPRTLCSQIWHQMNSMEHFDARGVAESEVTAFIQNEKADAALDFSTI